MAYGIEDVNYRRNAKNAKNAQKADFVAETQNEISAKLDGVSAEIKRQNARIENVLSQVDKAKHNSEYSARQVAEVYDALHGEYEAVRRELKYIAVQSQSIFAELSEKLNSISAMIGNLPVASEPVALPLSAEPAAELASEPAAVPVVAQPAEFDYDKLAEKILELLPVQETVSPDYIASKVAEQIVLPDYIPVEKTENNVVPQPAAVQSAPVELQLDEEELADRIALKVGSLKAEDFDILVDDEGCTSISEVISSKMDYDIIAAAVAEKLRSALDIAADTDMDYDEMAAKISDRLTVTGISEDSIADKTAQAVASAMPEVDPDDIADKVAGQVLEGMPKVDSEEISKAVLEGMPKVDSEEISKAVLEGMPKVDSEEISKAVLEGMPKVDSEEISKAVLEGMPKVDSEEISKAVLEGMPKVDSEEISKAVLEGMPKVDSEEISKAVLEGMPKVDSEEISRAVLEGMPKVDSEEISKAVADKLAEVQSDNDYEVVIDDEGLSKITEYVSAEVLKNTDARFDEVNKNIAELKAMLASGIILNATAADNDESPEDAAVVTVSEVMEDTEEVTEEAKTEETVEAEETADVEETTDTDIIDELVEEIDEAPADGEIMPEGLGADGQGGVDFEHMMKYNRSFIARIIQSTDDQKDYYGRVKTALLSYEKVNSSISWGSERFNKGRDTIARFKIRGKTLCLYLALDPAQYKYSVYHHVDVSDNKSMHGTPMMVKIKSPLGAKKAIRLIDDMLSGMGAVKRTKIAERDYSLMYPYTSTEDLIEDGLVKDVGNN